MAILIVACVVCLMNVTVTRAFKLPTTVRVLEVSSFLGRDPSGVHSSSDSWLPLNDWHAKSTSDEFLVFDLTDVWTVTEVRLHNSADCAQNPKDVAFQISDTPNGPWLTEYSFQRRQGSGTTVHGGLSIVTRYFRLFVISTYGDDGDCHQAGVAELDYIKFALSVFACPGGYQWSAGFGCAACAAGTYDADPTSSLDQCVPCPTGFNTRSGQVACLPLLAYVLEGMHPPQLQVVRNEYGVIQMSLMTSKLPPATYENTTLNFEVDIASEASNISVGSQCNALWVHAGLQLVANLHLKDLFGPCHLNPTYSAENVEWNGFVGLMVVEAHEGGSPLVKMSFVLPVALSFSRNVVDVYSGFTGKAPIILPVGRYHLGKFKSAVILYDSIDYTTQVRAAVYSEGSVVYAEHHLVESADMLGLQLVAAWLSTSLNHTDQTAIVANLTVTEVSYSIGGVRFRFQAPKCPVCFLHCISQVVHGPKQVRRLTPATEHAWAVKLIEIHDKMPGQVGLRYQEDGYLLLVLLIVLFLSMVALVLCVGACFYMRVQKFKHLSLHPVPGSITTCPRPSTLGDHAALDSITVDDMRIVAVEDKHILQDLARLVVPPVETKSAFGKGQDSDKLHRKKYSSLLVRRAWKLNLPALSTTYHTKRIQINKQMDKIKALRPSEVAKLDTVETLMDWAAEKFGLDGGCNEKILLHGTNPSAVENILNDGLDPGYIERSGFGFGNYLSEDPTKADQYCGVDSPLKAAEDKAIKHLHQTLYGTDKMLFPCEIHYMFVCQAVLGCPLHTKGPFVSGLKSDTVVLPKSLKGPTSGHSVFVNNGCRKLISVPGTTPQIPYHSLIVEKGLDSVVQRHREFVLFNDSHGSAVLPIFLLAYSREA